jgi:P-type Cu+ transporter
MEELKVDIAHAAARADELRREGATVMYIAAGGTLAGLIAVSDPVKASTPAALEALRKSGVHIVMLTGDNRTTAEAVAKRLGIDEGTVRLARGRLRAVTKLTTGTA